MRTCRILPNLRKIPRVEPAGAFPALSPTLLSSTEPGCPVVAEDEPSAGQPGEERYYVTRSELIALVDEALRAGK